MCHQMGNCLAIRSAFHGRHICGYNGAMKSVSLRQARDSLSRYVDEVSSEHEIIRITRHGHGAAVLMSEDDLESLHETLFWLSQPGIREDIDAAERVGDEEALSAEDVRARYGLL